jgi:hypothetical protein
MKINEKLIEDIFQNKIKLKNKTDKVNLSKFENLIPMYDIYTQKIYPIKKENLFHSLTELNYRFINHEIVKWINQIYDKNLKKSKSLKGEEKEQIQNLIERIKEMLTIIDNYDIDTLIDVSYKVLYHYSTSLGLSVSICKRNSFNPFIFYLKPYYTKIELIKLGQNMGIIDTKLKAENLIDVEKHYEICKKISNNDVSFDEIKEHTINILENKQISDIVFYSFIGASLLNKFLRNNTQYKLNKFFYNKLINLVNSIKNSPPLENDYQTYRFVAEDSFLKNLKIGDTFIDKGFTSTTRDPFYNPGMNGTFGLILIKINFKKNVKGTGLFIEHFSLFPKEEEYLLAPFSKLKLVSKNDNFKYYHINENFEKTIYKKYEFDFVSVDYSWIKKISLANEPSTTINFNDFSNIHSENKMQLLTKLKNMNNEFNELNIKGKLFHAFYFDSTESYSKFYLNKIQKGLSLIHFDSNGYPLIFIEMGKELVVNYIHNCYFYNNKEKLDEKFLIELLTDIGLHFNYKIAKIYNEYNNFSSFKKNYYSNQEVFLYLHHYDNTLYQYLKNNTKPYKFEIFYKNNFRKLDLLLNSKLDQEAKTKFNFDGNYLKDLIINTIENNFYQYSSVVNYFKLEDYAFGTFNILDKLVSMGKINSMMDINYNDDDDEIFKLTYRQPLRRT